VVVTQARRPTRKSSGQFTPHGQPAIELDAVALTVVEADGLDPGVAIKRPGQAGGGILAA
jgi:hypothetical protein